LNAYLTSSQKFLNAASKYAHYAFLFSIPFITSCAFQTYTAKPIDPEVVAQNFALKSPNDANFKVFLQNKGYQHLTFPIQQWNLNTLIECALFFHPSLNQAREAWKAAQASEKLASKKPQPTVNAGIGHSNQANDDINPFAYHFSIDIPIETQNKREIQIESFAHLSNVAKLEVAQTAWNLRYQVTQAWADLFWQQSQLPLQIQEVALRQEIVDMIEKRVQFGLASNIDLNQAKLQHLASRTQLQSLEKNQLPLIAKLANHLGLPLSAVNQMQFNFDALNSQMTAIPEIQATALLNRLDVRIALERYAVAEAKLKLEVAKQYPDISISPSYAYEFGDKIWSLGFSSLLNMLEKNSAAIQQATQLREVEVAQFESLQANVIAEAELNQAKLIQTQQQIENTTVQLKEQQHGLRQISAQLNAGEADRLALVMAKLAVLTAEKDLEYAHYQRNVAMIQLENSLQLPLITETLNASTQVSSTLLTQ
jgi:cobalt-zinc-cadmium efflux system outer membrane protein